VQFPAIASLVRLRRQRRPTAPAVVTAERSPLLARRPGQLVAVIFVVVLLAPAPALADPTVAEKRVEAQQVLEQVQLSTPGSLMRSRPTTSRTRN
jgi:hypothetical protein